MLSERKKGRKKKPPGTEHLLCFISEYEEERELKNSILDYV